MSTWIKLRTDLFDDPAVLRMSDKLGLGVYDVVGRLSDIWGWIGRHSTDGTAVPLRDTMIDAHIGREGFAAAMRAVGWLDGADGALSFPRWERHNSFDAKARVLEAEAKRLRREHGPMPIKPPKNVRKMSDKCPTSSENNGVKCPTREDKIRVQVQYPPPTPQEEGAGAREKERSLPPSLDTTGFRAAWARWVDYLMDVHRKMPPVQTLDAQLATLGGFTAQDAISAIDHGIERGYRAPALPIPLGKGKNAPPPKPEPKPRYIAAE